MTRFRNRHLLLSDLILIILAAYLSFVLRLESPDLKEHWRSFLLFTVLALICIPFIFWRAGIYARYWRYASVEELLLLAGSVTIGVVVTAALSLAIAFLVPGAPNVPRSIPFIFLLLALVSDRRAAPSGASVGAFHDHAAKRQRGSFAAATGADHGRG